MPPTNLFGLGYGVGPAGYGYPSAGSVAPPTLSYASPQSWTYGTAITPVSPTTTGATSFAVTSGALPTGISLDAGTGVLSGTPTQAKVAANVEITATGPGGSIAATINIAVPSPLYTSLVDYWNLDEESGTRVGSHAGLDLTDTNTVTSQATGGPDGGRCAQFTNANSECLSRADEAALRVGSVDYTVAAWVYRDSATGAAVLVSKYGSAHEYTMYIGSSASSISHYAGAAAVHSGTGTSLATWYFGVASYVTATTTVGIAKNNAAADTGSGTAASGNGGFRIGGDVGGLGVQYLDGRMAYVGFWKRILTAAEQTWLYNAGAGRAYSALATYDGG